jgi:hypothetical protein
MKSAWWYVYHSLINPILNDHYKFAIKISMHAKSPVHPVFVDVSNSSLHSTMHMSCGSSRSWNTTALAPSTSAALPDTKRAGFLISTSYELKPVVYIPTTITQEHLQAAAELISPAVSQQIADTNYTGFPRVANPDHIPEGTTPRQMSTTLSYIPHHTVVCPLGYHRSCSGFFGRNHRVWLRASQPLESISFTLFDQSFVLYSGRGVLQ